MSMSAEWKFVNITAASPVALMEGPRTGAINSARAVVTCTSGNCSATIILYGAHRESPEAWESLVTFSPSGSSSTPGSDSLTFTNAYQYYKAECSAISGTGAVAALRTVRA
jgi:hypothetical protein